MVERGLLSINVATREDDSERRRIAASMEKLPEGSRALTVMREYHAVLDERVRTETLTRRSMRLSVTPAVALLEAAHAAGRELPNQETLDAVLRQTPGQRAALAGVVRWLRETHDIALALAPPRAATTLKRRRERARGEMLTLMREGAGADDFAERWRNAALAYFHDLALKAAREVREDDSEVNLDGLRINVKGESYWIPSPRSATAETR